MKLLVSVLLASLFFSYVSAGGAASKKEVDVSELNNDSEIAGALKEGINWVFQHAANKYGVSGLNIEVTNVNSIHKWKENKNTYYSFDVEATNNDDAKIQANYTVRCDPSSVDKKVTQWRYHIEWKNKPDDTDSYGHTDEDDGETPDAGINVEINVDIDVEVTVEEEEINKCKDIDVAEVDNDSHLKDALTYGITWIFQKAHEKFGISKSDLVVVKINSLCSYEEDGNIYYSFDVEANNKDKDSVEATYNVRCNSEGSLRVVNKWRYVIHYGNNKADQTDSNDNNEDEETDSYHSDEENNKCQQGDEVDASEIDNNSDLKDALVHGISWVFKMAAEKFSISDLDIEVNQINSICKWKDGGNTYYSFDVEANNDAANVKATFDVRRDSKGNLSVVNKWNYNIDRNTNSDNTDNYKN